MSETIEGYKTPKLKALAPVLDQWVKTVKLCVSTWNGEDVPWWYGERASLSLFAGAIWRSGGLAFEEYASGKRFKSKKVGEYKGRADLYFELGKRGFVAEAKHAWSRARLSIDHRSNLQKRLSTAQEDIACVAGDGVKLAILFTAIDIPKKHSEKVDALVKHWLRLSDKIDASAWAWIFPQSTRHIGGDVLCPGGAVFIKRTP
jgi:hypothetical protein